MYYRSLKTIFKLKGNPSREKVFLSITNTTSEDFYKRVRIKLIANKLAKLTMPEKRSELMTKLSFMNLNWDFNSQELII